MQLGTATLTADASVVSAVGRISDALSAGQTPNNLLDQRDALVGSLSDAITLTNIPGKDGSANLFTVSGQSLVLGGASNPLVAQPDGFDPQRVALALKVGATLTPLDTQALGGRRTPRCASLDQHGSAILRLREHVAI